MKPNPNKRIDVTVYADKAAKDLARQKADADGVSIGRWLDDSVRRRYNGDDDDADDHDER